MAIRQKAKGQHTATFAVPTLANNAILVLLSSASGGLAVTDDKGNSYQTNVGNTGKGGATTGGLGGTQTAFIPLLNTMVAGIQTITANDASAYLWIYEITSLVFVGSGSPAFPDGNPDSTDGVGNEAGAVLLDPTWPWLWQNNLANGQALPASDDYFSIVYGDTGGFASVDSGWTFDGAQGKAAVAYLLGAGGPTFAGAAGCQGATFSPNQSSWCASGFSFRVSAPTPPTTGNIVIQKATVPGGSPQAFTFTPSYGAPFQLTDGQTNDSGALAPGSYSVVETPVAGWDTTVNANPANILVVAGQTTTVTFTNTKRLCQLAVSPASLSFVKDQCGTVPLPKSFTLTNIGNADVIPFTVSADQPWVILNPTAGNTPATVQVSVNLLGLAPGTYTATISFLSSCGNPVIPTVLVVLVVGQTVVAACIPDPNADAGGVPSLNGVFTSLVSSGQVVNPFGFPPGTYNFQSFTQAGPDVTAFGGELFSTLCGRQRIIMVVPDQYDDDGVGIDCQYLPWLAQMPPNVLGHGGFRAQLQGNGVIRMTPLNEKNDNRYKPLEVLLAPGPPISFEKGVRATEKYLGILFSNKKICGAFFIIQELVQYANPKYGGSRSPKT